jgi:hypothetical protein
MRFLSYRLVIFALVFLFTFAGSSCSKKSQMGLCKENNAYRNYHPKKNKSKYSQKYRNKDRSVRKDYVIKNGIAH